MKDNFEALLKGSVGEKVKIYNSLEDTSVLVKAVYLTSASLAVHIIAT